MNNIVIYHKNCNDGFGAALVAWLVFKEKAEYYPAAHYTQPPDVTDKNVYICDFSYKKDILEDMISKAKSLVVIDHHLSAKKDLEEIDNKYKVFDMNHSGAVLTWKYFFQDQKVPLLLEYIEDRDIWNNNLVNTKECFFALCDMPKEFELWNEYLDDNKVPELFEQGKIIYNHNMLTLKHVVRSSYLSEQSIDDKVYKIAYINSNTLKSDIGNYLVSKKYLDADFAAIYHYDGYDDKTLFSLRSKDDKADVSVIAKLFGGGGHRCASGCSLHGFSKNLGIPL